ncbi:MAG: hypothetical protein F6K09_06155 [Merismopedia sp. SIO2A8]|nr:hypothetical protein [Symploca sp. SIO2B6]NET48300.1 hypothetical protein [Merismopedia sp. SIO2A8]
MDLKRIANDTAKTVVSYLTYQSVRTVVAQLRETNPPLSIWFQSFSARTSIQDGEVYLKALMQENPDLALRVMTVRAHFAEEVADYMPEMIRAGVQQANMVHRRDYLERITALEVDDDHSEPSRLNSDAGLLPEDSLGDKSDRHPNSASEVDSPDP